MKQVLVLAAVLCGSSGIPGLAAEKDGRETVIKDMLALMKQATQILSTIKDEDTARAASPKLKKIGEQRKVIKERYQKLKLSKKEDAELRKKFSKDVKDQEAKLLKEIVRVRDIPGGKEAVKQLDPKKKSQ